MKSIAGNGPAAILLLLDSEMNWSPEEWAIQNGGRLLSDGVTLFGDCVDWVSIIRDDNALRDCTAARRATICGFVANPAAYVLGWNYRSGAAEKLLAAVPEKSKAAIETRLGFVASLESLRDLCLDFAANLAFAGRTRRL